jgi:DNA-binding transcriptional LysR family regulator
MESGSLQGLIALQKLGELGTFRRAAQALGVSPSAMSQAIKQLESRLGVQLVSRTTRSTKLTAAGERFVGQITPALSDISFAMDEVRQTNLAPRGILRLNLSRISFPMLMRPLLREFLDTYPSLQLELHFDDTLQDIVRGGFDAGIRPGELTARDMVAIRMTASHRYVITGSPAYLERNPPPMIPSDLKDHECVLFRYASGTVYNRWELEAAGQVQTVPVRGQLILNDPYLMIEAAKQGIGLIHVPEAAISQNLRTGQLQLVLEEFALHSPGFFLYYPRRKQMSVNLRVFVDYLRRHQIDV